jgi:hypothetical protein
MGYVEPSGARMIIVDRNSSMIEIILRPSRPAYQVPYLVPLRTNFAYTWTRTPYVRFWTQTPGRHSLD